MIELERTFLAKRLPSFLRCKKTEVLDIYIPTYFDHPKIRIRKLGDKYELTKKYQIDEADHFRLIEENINLSEGEFCALEKELKGKRVHKIRYFFNWKGKIAEFDVFQGDLIGLVLVGVKFTHEEEMYSFKMPDFCLADITEEDFTSGSFLCGKSYKEIENHLSKFNYKQLFVK